MWTFAYFDIPSIIHDSSANHYIWAVDANDEKLFHKRTYFQEFIKSKNSIVDA